MAKKEYTTINRGNENFSWASFKVDCDKRLGQAVNHFPILCLAVISQRPDVMLPSFSWPSRYSIKAGTRRKGFRD